MGATVLVCCLDGLDHEYLNRFKASTPVIHSIADSGFSALLSSTFPPFTPSAWPSFYTGTNPGDHGVFSFFTFDGYPDQASVVSIADVNTPALWEYLADRGKKTLVLDLPVTHPAPTQSGVFVPGYLAPSAAETTPSNIRDRLAALTDRPYQTYCPVDANPKTWYPDRIDQVTAAAEWLLSERMFDLAVVCIQATDTIFHVSDDPADYERVYAAADEFVARMRAAADPDYLLICSDHGMQTVDGYTIRVNQHLANVGLLKTTRGTSPPTLREGLAAQRETSSLPDREGEATIDWRRSTAFLRTPTEFGVRINLTGREPDGSVDPTNYEAVRDRLIDTLSSIVLPTGEPAFDWIRRREDQYGVDVHENAPDIVFKPAETAQLISASVEHSSVLNSPQMFATHREDGVLVVDGSNAFKDTSLEGVSLVDLAPTILTLLNEPIPERMCGEVLVADAAPRLAYDIRTKRCEESDVDNAVWARLDDLGYL